MESIFIFIHLWYDKNTDYFWRGQNTDMTVPQIIILCAGVAVILIALSIFFVSRSKRKKSGALSRKKIASILRNFAGIRSFRVINDIDLPLEEGRYTHIDHILIGFFGLMVLENRTEPGAIYGEARDKEWVSVVTKKNNSEFRKKFKNPVTLNQEHCEAIRKIFQQEKIYKVDIESYVVFTDPKIQLGAQPNLPVMNLKKFKKLLSHSRYSDNGPVDVSAVYSAIMKRAKTK